MDWLFAVFAEMIHRERGEGKPSVRVGQADHDYTTSVPSRTLMGYRQGYVPADGLSREFWFAAELRPGRWRRGL